jgi:hypothetical protein
MLPLLLSPSHHEVQKTIELKSEEKWGKNNEKAASHCRFESFIS